MGLALGRREKEDDTLPELKPVDSDRKGGRHRTEPTTAYSAGRDPNQRFGERAPWFGVLDVQRDTLGKAIADGRLCEPPVGAGADKSARSVQDAAAGEGMGTACTRIGERVLAALGKLHGAPVRLELCRDVPYGGVLCALPALIANGLLGRCGASSQSSPGLL